MSGLLSIWLDDPAQFATAIGLFRAGLAFALQRVVTAVAGYVVILRDDTVFARAGTEIAVVPYRIVALPSRRDSASRPAT